jgi:PKD repeat protein
MSFALLGAVREVCSLARLSRALVCACMVLVLATGAAQGTELHPRVGKLPGYPAMRGVVPVLGSSAAVAAHEELVSDAFAAAATRFSKGLKRDAEPNTELIAACAEEAAFLASHDVCYRGGPVVHDPTIHLIYWQGAVGEDKSKEPNVELFPHGYAETVNRYFADLVHDSGQATNTFAVDPQYGEEVAGKYTAGEYAMKFEVSSTDITVDNEPFPVHEKAECDDESKYSKGPCLLDSDIQAEVEKVAKTSEAGLHDIYVVLTPPGVGGCFEESSGECAYKAYCAYHSDFGGDGVTPGEQTLYADLPYVGKVEGCESGVNPNSSEGADGVIDDASHEINETITDPIGSQCESGATRVSQCERNAWTDAVGQEIADKCLPPESTVAGTYGEPLGEVILGDPTSAYNELIDGEPYWTQRVWSNEAGVFEGGCVQRAIGASFSVSTDAAASVPVTFNGSSSGAPGDPAVYWVWSFGEEDEQVGTASPTISHAFAQSGEHAVGLTAYDAYGNSEGTVESVAVGPAPVPSPTAPVPPSAPPRIPPPVIAYSAAQVAKKLGLPASKATIAGGGRIALGHAECPPACTVSIRLYTSVRSTVKHRRVVKLVSIGSLSVRVATNGSHALALSLNSTGSKLLRQDHKLVADLSLTVVGQDGGRWSIARTLNLTSKS